MDAAGNALSTTFGHAMEHKFVATPSPMIGESPLMTWGEIEGTPFRLDAGQCSPISPFFNHSGDMAVRAADVDGPTFKMPAVPARDKLAHEMTDTIAKRYHDKRRIAVDAAAKAHTYDFC